MMRGSVNMREPLRPAWLTVRPKSFDTPRPVIARDLRPDSIWRGRAAKPDASTPPRRCRSRRQLQSSGGALMTRRNGIRILRALCAGVALLAMAGASGQAARQFSFAYDQPTTTAYGVAGNIFDAKLKELSDGKFSINQFPGGQLGQEPQLLQKLRAGAIDFVITS